MVLSFNSSPRSNLATVSIETFAAAAEFTNSQAQGRTRHATLDRKNNHSIATILVAFSGQRIIVAQRPFRKTGGAPPAKSLCRIREELNDLRAWNRPSFSSNISR